MPKGVYTHKKPGYWAGKKRPDISEMFTDKKHPSERKEIEKLAAQKRKERGGYIDSPETTVNRKEGKRRQREKYGYINSPETRLKLAQRIVTPESNLKRSIAMTGKHWKCSIEANKRRLGRTPAPGKRYYFEVPGQGRVCLRSSWELTVAKYLVDKQVDFRYECKRFILDAKTYLPDFYLIHKDKFLEVKGWMNKDALQKMEEMK